MIVCSLPSLQSPGQCLELVSRCWVQMCWLNHTPCSVVSPSSSRSESPTNSNSQIMPVCGIVLGDMEPRNLSPLPERAGTEPRGSAIVVPGKPHCLRSEHPALNLSVPICKMETQIPNAFTFSDLTS